MKIKIIDLFVKIANKENIPKKLLYKYKNKDFYEEYLLEWSDKHKAYFYVSNENGESYPIADLLAANLWNLNDELEILEEKPKYIEKKEIDGEYWLPSKELTNDYEFKKFVLDDLEGRNETIEELRIAVNYLLKKEKEKEK